VETAEEAEVDALIALPRERMVSASKPFASMKSHATVVASR